MGMEGCTDSFDALLSSVATATAPSVRSASLVLSHLGASSHSGSDQLRSTAMASLLHLLPPVTDLRSERETDLERRKARRVTLARLCCALHARMAQPRDTTIPPFAGRPEPNEVDVLARVALEAAPLQAAQVLARCGCWQPLILGPDEPAQYGATALDLPSKLRLLRSAAIDGALVLAEPSETHPSTWAQLLATLATETSDEHADAQTLLTLALLPPPAACTRPEAILGAQLEVFVRHWVSHSWPHAPLLSTMRSNMQGAHRRSAGSWSTGRR